MFAKSSRANINSKELRHFKGTAKLYLEYTDDQLGARIKDEWFNDAFKDTPDGPQGRAVSTTRRVMFCPVSEPIPDDGKLLPRTIQSRACRPGEYLPPFFA
jgi:hypothetical protein